MQTVLATGGAGYVGSGFMRTLLKAGYRVICADILRYGGESIIDIWHEPNFTFYKCDINDHDSLDRVLQEHQYDAVVHLAAIVGDPACKREPDLATLTNWTSSKHLVDRCVELGIRRFVFASTCSNYGKMSNHDTYVTEDSDLTPVSLYAELKVRFERYILQEIPKADWFCPTVLRFATVYGLSPRMRFDLTLNQFTKELAVGSELVVFGEQFWRPYCHVRDFSRAFMIVLEAAQEKVAYNVFNVGDTNENYTKKMLLEEIIKQIPDGRVRYVESDEDPRDYRVNSDKIKRELGFEITMTVPEGIAEIKRIVSEGVIEDPDDPRYYNIPHTRD